MTAAMKITRKKRRYESGDRGLGDADGSRRSGGLHEVQLDACKKERGLAKSLKATDFTKKKKKNISRL